MTPLLHVVEKVVSGRRLIFLIPNVGRPLFEAWKKTLTVTCWSTLTIMDPRKYVTAHSYGLHEVKLDENCPVRLLKGKKQ